MCRLPVFTDTRLKYEPQTLEELQTSINLHERLLREQPEQEASFPVMEEQFVVLGMAASLTIGWSLCSWLGKRCSAFSRSV